MTGLPDSYASPLHLPFNRHCLAGRFAMKSPIDDPGGEGVGVLVRHNRLFVTLRDDAALLPRGVWTGEQVRYLGEWDGQPCRLVELEGDTQVTDDLVSFSLLDEQPQLPIELLSMGGLGRMLLHWQAHSRHCGACGGETNWLGDGWGRACPKCLSHAFPAIHPCAIVLVTRPGEVLLTRKANWAPGRYSLVAGFQEPGESLEETASREVAEETGIRISNLRYVGSQCWPFPSQVMVGFAAEAAGGELQVDARELDDARWFPVDDLPKLPPKRSIARYILDSALGLP